jgi:hypothetical protein
MPLRLPEGDEDGDEGDELGGVEEGVLTVETVDLVWELLEVPPRAVSRAALSE